MNTDTGNLLYIAMILEDFFKEHDLNPEALISWEKIVKNYDDMTKMLLKIRGLIEE